MAEGGFSGRFPLVEDYDLWSRLALGGAHFATLPEPLTRYRLHGGAIKALHTKAQLRATIAEKER